MGNSLLANIRALVRQCLLFMQNLLKRFSRPKRQPEKKPTSKEKTQPGQKMQPEQRPQVDNVSPLLTATDSIASTCSEGPLQKKPSRVTSMVEAYEKRMSLVSSSSGDCLTEKKKVPSKKEPILVLLSVLSTDKNEVDSGPIPRIKYLTGASENPGKDNEVDVSDIPWFCNSTVVKHR